LPISLLPYSILYFISDILYIIIFKIIGYRRTVVSTNLTNSFPEKDKQELYAIMSDFYRHLCDLIIESLKGFTISEKEIKSRLVVKNPELSNSFAKKGQSIIFVGGHYNNWEICAQAFSLHSSHNCIGIYKPLSNKFLNKKIYSSRTKFGTSLVSMKQAKKSFSESNKAKAIVFGSDQNPSNPKSAYWLRFLNQDTAVLFGAEKYAKDFNFPVIYVGIKKVKRGHYEVEYSLVTDKPKEEEYGKITEDFTKRLEQDIIKEPQYWLWSHRRWKHKK
jgi:KDO2-lipid IV(A) lauroyltransferase